MNLSGICIYLKNAASAISGCINLLLGLPDEKEKRSIYGVIYEGEFYCTGAGENYNIKADSMGETNEILTNAQIAKYSTWTFRYFCQGISCSFEE